MRISMDTGSSGSARIDSTDVLPSGGLRGPTKLIKITEDVRKYAAEQGVTGADVLAKGIQQKARVFADAGAELYAKA